LQDFIDGYHAITNIIEGLINQKSSIYHLPFPPSHFIIGATNIFTFKKTTQYSKEFLKDLEEGLNESN